VVDLSFFSLFLFPSFRFVLSFKEKDSVIRHGTSILFEFPSASDGLRERHGCHFRTKTEAALRPACMRVGALEGGAPCVVTSIVWAVNSASFVFFFSFGKERTIAVLSLIMSFWTKTRAARVAPRFASSHRYDLTPGV